MRVHPTPNKRIAAAAASSLISRQKKLRRLPHIFSKVLELPFPSDADVSVHDGPAAFRFVVPTLDLLLLHPCHVAAHAVEVLPGVLKVVIRDGGESLEEELELDRWRFRLPKETRPRLARAEHVDGELIVTVPKGFGDEEEDEEQREGFGILDLLSICKI